MNPAAPRHTPAKATPRSFRIDRVGCDKFFASLVAGLRPDPDHTVTTWAEANVVLSSASAAEPGPYRVARTPYAREIQDCLSPSYPANRVVFIKGTQIGGTQIGLNAIGFYIAHSPCPIMFIQKTVDAVKRVSKQRIAPMIAESAALRALVSDARSRDSGNTMLQKDYPGGTLIMTGANSAVGLRSMPARFLFPDEVDSYEAEADDEGDPIKLAERRTQTFGHRRKIFLVSTPTTKGRSRIEAEFEASDQRFYHVPCPHCGETQPLIFKNLRWEKNRPETVHYVCAENGCIMQESAKEVMLAWGRWVATYPDREVAGFHLNSLYSPPGWMSWREIASEWIEADADRKIGKHEKHKTFVNTILAETFEERAERPDWHRLYDRREHWPVGLVPMGAMVLTAGVDVQLDRLECSVWGWGERDEKWLIEHRVFYGQVNLPEHWAELDKFINEREWRHESGQMLELKRVIIDSGAFTTNVYAFVRTQNPQKVYAGKGQQLGASITKDGTEIDPPPSRGKTAGGRKILLVSTSMLKVDFYRTLALERPTEESGDPFPAGYVHLSTAVDENGCRQLTSETFTGKSWVLEPGERNEWLDCYIYARAAAHRAGVDQMSESDWEYQRAKFDGPTREEIAAAPERHRSIKKSADQRPQQWVGPTRQKKWV